MFLNLDQLKSMGLDITYYTNMRLVDCVFDADGEPIDPVTRAPISGDYTQVHVNPDFPGRADEFADRGVYTYDSSGHFRAGSYSGYNQWRKELARLAGYPQADYESYGRIEKRHDAGCWQAGSGPFFELVHFSDCEGTLGTAICQKLLQDFDAFAEAAQNHDAGEHTHYWLQRYQEWHKAVRTAAENKGAVCFH